MLEKIFQSGVRWIWLTIVVILIDRVSKSLILYFFKLDESVELTRFFNLTLAYNKGAAFSFLSSASGWQSKLFGMIALIVSGILFSWLLRLSYKQIWTACAVSMILGGAVGNLLDRIFYSHVVDFIQWHIGQFYWPVFNIADSAICIGAIMLIVEAFKPSSADTKLKKI